MATCLNCKERVVGVGVPCRCGYDYEGFVEGRQFPQLQGRGLFARPGLASLAWGEGARRGKTIGLKRSGTTLSRSED